MQPCLTFTWKKKFFFLGFWKWLSQRTSHNHRTYPPSSSKTTVHVVNVPIMGLIKKCLIHFQGHFILYQRTIKSIQAWFTLGDSKCSENHWYTSSEHQWYQWGACPEPKGYWETAPTPAAACSLCCCLAKDTEVPSVVLLEFWLHDF